MKKFTSFKSLFGPLLFLATLTVYADNVHLAMGNPSQATSDPAQKDNYLMDKEYFALSYNNSKATPNWVSWKLIKSDMGSAQRGNDFHPDQSLPDGFTRVVTSDYSKSGFDRGHMCDAADRSANDDSMEATFAMSNIIPQSPNVNRKAWERLEAYCRELVNNEGKTLYIVSGPVGKGGAGSGGAKGSIGAADSITVPAKCWKVIMVLDKDIGDDPTKVPASTRLIAVIMPNDMSVGEAWAGFRVPAKSVEELTGYKFFDKVPSAIIAPLKEKVDDQSITQRHN